MACSRCLEVELGGKNQGRLEREQSPVPVPTPVSPHFFPSFFSPRTIQLAPHRLNAAFLEQATPDEDRREEEREKSLGMSLLRTANSRTALLRGI